MPELKFSGVKLSRSQGSKTFTPEGSSFALDRENLDVVLNNAFMAVQNPVSGSLIKVEEGSGGKGFIRGHVRLENSFNFNPSLFSFENSGAWITEREVQELVLWYSGLRLTR